MLEFLDALQCGIEAVRRHIGADLLAQRLEHVAQLVELGVGHRRPEMVCDWTIWLPTAICPPRTSPIVAVIDRSSVGTAGSPAAAEGAPAGGGAGAAAERSRRPGSRWRRRRSPHARTRPDLAVAAVAARPRRLAHRSPITRARVGQATGAHSRPPSPQATGAASSHEPSSGSHGGAGQSPRAPQSSPSGGAGSKYSGLKTRARGAPRDRPTASRGRPLADGAADVGYDGAGCRSGNEGKRRRTTRALFGGPAESTSGSRSHGPIMPMHTPPCVMFTHALRADLPNSEAPAAPCA
jgi:hypothetical protein